ncbi:MAG: dihydropteroate synthase [Cytophagales bacterium]|nr:MAG: dihydropteroate synthase [Cytophagales bacterium]
MDYNDIFNQAQTLNLYGRLISLRRPIIMGVVNATPDSFFSSSRVKNDKEIIHKVNQMIEQGATIIDLGGCSTRPNAEFVSENEELDRVLPIIKLLKHEFPLIIISIDTFRARVASKALESGASMVNDISGGQLDEEMFSIISDYKAPYILTHFGGTIDNFVQPVVYKNLIKDMLDYFEDKVNQLTQLGHRELIIDLGFGFSKTVSQNYEVLQYLELFKIFNLPILVGLSRKSMIYKELNIKPEEALNGTTVLHTIALNKGAKILRVHDVKAAQEAIILCEKIIS